MQQATPESRPISRSNTTLARLEERASVGRPVRVGVVGAGDYGESLVCQLATIPGMVPSIVCDLSVDKGMAAFEMAGMQATEISVPGTQGELDDRVASDRPAISQDFDQVVRSPIDVVVDCTGEPEVGARLACSAIEHGKHVVMVNVEADVTVGLELAQMAHRAGVTYSLADGDQPSLVVELVDWARSLGFDVVCAGKSTRVRPWEVARESLTKREVLTKSHVTYADVTKTQIEMASAANACNLSLDVEGMHGPSLPIDEMPGMLRPDTFGGMMSHSGVIDYVNDLLPSGERVTGAFKGMFVIGMTAPERSRQVMASKGVIMSPDRLHTLLYRPYHLVGVETPWSIQRAVLDNVPTAAPYVRNVEVIAVAKRTLKSGELLVGIGTDEIKGVAVTAADASENRLVPAGMMEGCRLRRDVAVDEKLRFDDIERPDDSVIWRLRGLA